VNWSLAVVENDDAFVVVVDGEPKDWLVRFEKRDGFPARHWADNMARACNERPAVGDPAAAPHAGGFR
jgi:hypothetical protein